MNKRNKGTLGEDIAVDYLEKKGYRILERNFRFGRGEIDVVVEDEETLVFVEVKARHSTMFGDPEDAVTEFKRLQIRKIAEGYLFKHHIEQQACRFDVIAIQFSNSGREVRHFKDAF